MAEALAFLVRINLVLAAAVLLVLALRRVMRLQFGARAAYALWWVVPTALIATALPARTIETSVDAAAIQTAPLAPAASSSGTWAQTPATGLIDLSSLLLSTWLVGVTLMFLMFARRQRVFVASLGGLSRDTSGALRAQVNCVGPMILGALRPQLVLPRDFETQFESGERTFMVAHERVHLKRGDAQINGLAALVQCLCWFNPLAHAAALAMRVDQELACDATVAERYPGTRRAYAAALLKAQLAPMSLPLGCTWLSRRAHPLTLRIAMLKHRLPGTRRAAAGSFLAALVCLAAGWAAWAAQPPRVVTFSIGSIADARLLRAVLQGDVRLAEAAIRAGADVNVRTASGLTALTIAASAENMDTLHLLLEHGADVHLTSPGEGNALIAAGRRGHVRAVTALVESGAAVDEIVPEYGTPLVAAARTGHLFVVRYLVEHGASVNLASPLPTPWDRWGVMRTPLEVAISGNHESTADYLRSISIVGATIRGT